ncbi:Vps74p [Rhizophagus irregularis DAOM 197198w]|uniref:Vps74p n=2 Tax=Rhizophagus irregularis TaxID=588596 RepID=A0A015M1M6_RHIIW|nr:Vps74p [Rhizophagus irregularis DAOM 197198w]
MELALRGRIAMTKDSNRRKCPLSDRIIEVLEDKLTGEVLLDEALKLMKNSEPMSVGNWIDLMSGETWNVMKIGYQLKQVRECLAKGLVDKGILRTEKRNFLLFDMATHPVSDSSTKEEIVNRAIHLLLNHELREKAYTKVDELLSEYSTHPFSKKVKADIPEGKELQVEVVFTVLNVFTKMDSIL